PQAPGAGIRPLGYRANKARRAVALASLCSYNKLYSCSQTDAKRRQGRPAAAPYWRDSQGHGCAHPALEVK
ncbi:hypothetical protein, partial [Parasphingorhabdus sp.]